MSPVPILAEPGGTHEGSLARLHQLLDVAADAGCTIFKPQWTSNPARMVHRRRAGPQYLDAYQRLAFPRVWHAELDAHAQARGLGYVVSIYLPEDVAAVAGHVDAIKVASFEARDTTLLDEIEGAGIEAWVSTGMMAGDDVAALVARAALVFHCVSAYPAPPAEWNLGAIRAMARLLPDVPIGYSDHGAPDAVDAGAWAIAAGAQALEVHMRLDDCDPANPDAVVAKSPAQLAAYVQQARRVETALGDGVKRAQPCEAPMRAYRVDVR
jgi:N-acetylneuraminate synthase/N,N'-diacetyllegionaminate synthase